MVSVVVTAYMMALVTVGRAEPVSGLGAAEAHLADGPHHLSPAGEAGGQAVQDSDVLQQLLVGLPVLTVLPERS